MKFPLIAFKNNIVFNNQGEAYAVYRLKGEAYNHLPLAERQIVIKRLEEVFYGYEGKGQILLLCEELRLDEGGYLAAAGVSYDLPREVALEASRHARSVRQALSYGARRRRRYLVLQLRLEPQLDDIKTLLAEARDLAVGTFLRSEKWLLSPRRLQEALEAEKELYHRIRNITAGRADFGDLDFIIRRNTRRVGILSPPLPSRNAGRFTPALISAFSDGCLLEEHPSYIAITEGSDETHYQVFITFPDLPKSIPEIGAEWLASLDINEAAIDAVVHFRITRPFKAKKATESRRRFLRGQIEEALRGRDEPSLDEEYGLTEGRFLESKIQAGQPLAAIAVTLAVAGKDLKEVRATAAKTIERHTSSGYRAVRPVGDQIKCLYSFLPGAPPAASLIECDPGFIAAAGPHISLETGDGKGFFLGWSGAAPVWWRPGYAARELGRSNAVFITGGLGGGKSMTIKTMGYFIRLAGGVLFVIDPKKNEYRAYERLFPIKRIDLSPGGDRELNPFMLAADERRAKGIALDFLSIALNLRDDNDVRRVAVSQAVERVATRPPAERNLQACLEELNRMAREKAHPQVAREAGQCALLLESLRDGSLGHLVFGKEKENEIAPVTVVSLQGLPLPRTAQNLLAGRITESERQGLGMLYLAAAMAREVAFSLPAHIIKGQIFDEVWMLAGISEGARLLDELIRMGARSYNAIPILATQNASDVAGIQTIKNNVSYVLCFRAQDKSEIRSNIELLGADVEEEEGKKGAGLANLFRSLESGWCLMKDALGRIGQVYIDPRPEYLLQVFDTTPGKEGEVTKSG
ncbi:AAA-like domain protein [Neomoorella glycerini]|uniref:AAA-like domain protein n=1 Tax=Neomoorella glycerini TaxID=55779 RepID=A0A6I5ZTF8_9FIRM|nr:ATP-binding protein [Moorella glycerini]QGP93353.1 AAA-like domain protein [Moorella glycerini]